MYKARVLIAIAVLGLTARPSSATQLTCEKGTESYCEAWCAHAGGGMSGNPDGSVTCTVVQSAMEHALQTPMKKENVDKLKDHLGDLQFAVSLEPKAPAK